MDKLIALGIVAGTFVAFPFSASVIFNQIVPSIIRAIGL
jgi:hypothetical protein